MKKCYEIKKEAGDHCINGLNGSCPAVTTDVPCFTIGDTYCRKLIGKTASDCLKCVVFTSFCTTNQEGTGGELIAMTQFQGETISKEDFNNFLKLKELTPDYDFLSEVNGLNDPLEAITRIQTRKNELATRMTESAKDVAIRLAGLETLERSFIDEFVSQLPEKE